MVMILVVFRPAVVDCEGILFSGVVLLLMGFICDRIVVRTGSPPGVGVAL